LKRYVSTFLILSTLCDALPATAFALGLLLASPAVAANSDAQATLGDSACGVTVETNLAAAQKALQSNDKATRAALACLVAATSALNEKVRNDKIGEQASGMLAVPVRDDGPKLNQ